MFKLSKWSAKRTRMLVAAVVVLGVAGVVISMVTRNEVIVTPGKATVRRISEEQYRNIIEQVFGPTIDVGGRFPPDLRRDGLLAVGYSEVGATPAAVEQYGTLAGNIATQVLDQKHRKQLMPCQPASANEPDDACARQFLEKVGLFLFRRPLSPATLDTYVGAVNVAMQEVPDFYYGLSLSLAAMLSSPQFLFREVVLEPDPDHAGGYRLDAYSKASELSFFLWNSSPDPVLLAVAENGELNTRAGLTRQIDRLMTSPRFQAGVRAFFNDFLRFAELPDMTKDVLIYPKFSAQVAADAREQTLRTILDLQQGDYRDIFTTKHTYLTRELGAIYRVPVANALPNGSPDTWQRFEFAADDPREGVLSHLSFTALHSHPGRSSPTLRGQALREVFLCQIVPPPPGDVAFTIVQDTDNPAYKTTRDRLTAHRVEPACAGCHKIMDPMGLALESFDGLGAYRTTENGVAIDTSGELDGVPFPDSAGLGKAMHDNASATSCLVKRLTAYALGRPAAAGEAPWIKALQKDFADNGYRVTDLIRELASSQSFYLRAAPQTAVASATGQQTSAVKLAQGNGASAD